MRRLLYLLLGVALAIPAITFAVQISVPSPAGYGYIPVGNANKTYTPTATSSLGIVGTPNGALATTTADYIIYTQGSVVRSLKTSTNTIVSSSASTDVVLAATLADNTSGASIFFKAGTYYLYATTTFAGNDTDNDPTYTIQGDGNFNTKFVVVNNADGFYLTSRVHVNFTDFSCFITGSANCITSHSGASAERSFWKSSFRNLYITSTTTNATGWSMILSNDLRNTYDNIQMIYVPNGIRGVAESSAFNPGDSFFSNVQCNLKTQAAAGSQYCYYFDGSSGGVVNQDVFEDVNASDDQNRKTAWYLNHTKWMKANGLNVEGFATTTDMYNTSENNDFRYNYIQPAQVAGVIFNTDSGSISNSFNCAYIDGKAAFTYTVFQDFNTSTNKPNVLQGIDGVNCSLNGTGTYVYNINSASVVRDIRDSVGLDNTYNSVKIAQDKLYLDWGNASGVWVENLTAGMEFFTNNLFRVIITSGGNVGIGTTSPQTALDLSRLDTNAVITTGNQAAIRITNRDSATTNNMSELSFVGNDTGGTGLRNSAIMGINNNHTPGAMSGALAFVTRNAGTFAERVRITSAGNVGTGTTSPFANLSIQAKNGDTNLTLFAIGSSTQSATSTLFSVSNIGSTTLFQIPSSLLKTNSSGVIVAAIPGTDYANFGYDFTPSNNFGLTTNATTTPIWFQAGLQASSTAQLTDINTIGLYAFATSSTVATSTLISYNGQNFLSASSTAFNTALGLSALANVTAATSSTAIGYQALLNATSSYSNTAVGYQALKSSATISNTGFNTAVGYQALSGITSGNNNTAMGFFAGLSLTSGAQNTYLGSLAGAKSLTSSNNVAIGYSAGTAQTTAFSNTIVGANSGQAIVQGNNNTIVGAAAGITFTNGGNNVLMGASAGRNINGTSASTTALGNSSDGGAISSSFLTIGSTYVGAQSGQQVTGSSDYNAFFGAMTGQVNSSGYDNTFLGAYAGANNTTGANNIALGWNSILPSPTNSNQLSIGNFIFGTNLPATTSATTLTLPTTGLLGIGTSSPFAKFSIQTNNGDTATTLFAIGSSTQTATTTLFKVSNTGIITSGVGITASSTQVVVGKWQQDVYNTAGTEECMFVVGTTLTISAGACNP